MSGKWRTSKGRYAAYDRIGDYIMTRSPLSIKISEIEENKTYHIEVETGGNIYRGIMNKIEDNTRSFASVKHHIDSRTGLAMTVCGKNCIHKEQTKEAFGQS